MGVGPLQTWNWSVSPIPYHFLDNQFLLLIWWAGLPCGICYIILLLKSLISKPKNIFSNYLSLVANKFIIFYWILACLGVAIYVTVSSELYNYFITLLMGLSFEKSFSVEGIKKTTDE